MQTFGALFSARPGEIQLDDLCQQTDVSDSEAVIVTALDRYGLPVDVALEFTDKWCRNGFTRQLACPRCRQPCRVLRDGPTGFACGRCAPPRSEHHNRKNSTEWASLGGKETSEVVRGVGARREHRLPKLCGALVDVVTDLAQDAGSRSDAILALVEAADAARDDDA